MCQSVCRWLLGVLRSSVFHCAVLCKVKGKNVLKNDHWTVGTNSAVLLDAREELQFLGGGGGSWLLRRWRRVRASGRGRSRSVPGRGCIRRAGWRRTWVGRRS